MSRTTSSKQDKPVRGQHQAHANGQERRQQDDRSELRDSPTMARLLDALEEGTDIGHFGQLTFAIVARHFMEEDDLLKLLAAQPDMDETKARALVLQVQQRDYNPPKRDRLLQWQAQQDFPLVPDENDPNSSNLYRELRFPDGIYDHIQEFWEEIAESEEKGEHEGKDSR